MHVRNRVVGTTDRPRVCVFRSNLHIYAQIIDDDTGKTLASASSLKIPAPQAEPVAEKAGDGAEGAGDARESPGSRSTAAAICITDA